MAEQCCVCGKNIGATDPVRLLHETGEYICFSCGSLLSEFSERIKKIVDDNELEGLKRETDRYIDSELQGVKNPDKLHMLVTELYNRRMEKKFNFPVLFSFRDSPSWSENGEYGYTLYILTDGSVILEEEPILRRRDETTCRFPRGKIPEIVPQIRSFLEDHAKELEQIPSGLHDASMDDNYIDITFGEKEFHLWWGELRYAFEPAREWWSEEDIRLYESVNKLAYILADFKEILDPYNLPLELEVILAEGINSRITDYICRTGRFSDEGTSPFPDD